MLFEDWIRRQEGEVSLRDAYMAGYNQAQPHTPHEIDQHIRNLQALKEHYYMRLKTNNLQQLRVGDRVRVLKDCWEGWGPAVGSICYVHELADTNLWIGSKTGDTGSFYTLYDRVELINDE